MHSSKASRKDLKKAARRITAASRSRVHLAHRLLFIKAARPSPLADTIRLTDRVSHFGGFSSVFLDLLFHQESQP
ncbi:MAG TPA: hypothetical protein VN289_05795 [Paraburkholderia sp.]|jgi:hypothetical protein|nr:hypothetical protein [Paraburkholderia sp.]